MKFKNIFFWVITILILFIIPYFCRKNRKNDIVNHSMYAFGQITKKTGSLKNGEHWHYEFSYNGKIYKSYEPTDVKYNVRIGDFFIVNFSYKNPNHSILYYKYKLRSNLSDFKNYVDTILPRNILQPW